MTDGTEIDPAAIELPPTVPVDVTVLITTAMR